MTDMTHNAKLRSWVDSANGATDFPIQNLPFGIFSRHGDTPRGGVAIGNQVFDIAAANRAGLFDRDAEMAAKACESATLNALMSLGRGPVRALRLRLVELLRERAPERGQVESFVYPMAQCRMHLPASIGDYTDFYASIHHATNVGSLFRPDNPLLPNYKWVPIGYHGRASSIVVSGTEIKRPHGQTKEESAAAPVFGPTKRLDYEMEVGFFVGKRNRMGLPISIDDASAHLFGFCLVNDWSARDIQAWEYQPLGPFLAKNFATTISPWVVTLDALEPFRVPAATRAEGDPAPLPYLTDDEDRARGGFNITVEVYLSSPQMDERGLQPFRISSGSFRDMYWTVAQMLTHHASNGCNLQPGDLLASGTVSGPTKDSRGCLLELTPRGAESVVLPTGEERRFLVDGDEVIFRAFCEREGFARIGFGECSGTIGR